MNQNPVHQHFFHILLLVVTVALGWILLPFFGAVFWGTILAILFQPLQRWLTIRFGKRRNLAALTTLVLIILIVILPLTVVAGTLVQEISLAYARIKTVSRISRPTSGMRSMRCRCRCSICSAASVSTTFPASSAG